MIKKWEIKPSPSKTDPDRHKLFIDGSSGDIQYLIKKLGGLCGRPQKTESPYTYFMYLIKPKRDAIKKVEEAISKLSASERQAGKEEPPKQASASGYPAAGIDKDASKIGKPGAARLTEPPSLASLIERAGLSAKSGKVEGDKQKKPQSLSDILKNSGYERKNSPETNTAAVKPGYGKKADAAVGQMHVAPPVGKYVPADGNKSGNMPSAPKQTEEVLERVPSGPKTGDTPPRKQFLSKEEIEKLKIQAQPISAKKEFVVPEHPQEPVSDKSRWGLESPRIPTCNFETLIVGPHNRFAHAASMAVVENPGTMYNPLLLFGGSGIGKTHFLNSIACGLSVGYGQENVIVTDGVRISKGVMHAVKNGYIEKIESLLGKAKALMVDDIHLMILEDESKRYLSKWFNIFINSGKQIVLTSIYPPKALAGLEQSLGFHFSQGWMVDLKMPNPQTHRIILDQILRSMDVALGEEETVSIFCKNPIPIGEAAKIIKSLRSFIKIAPDNISYKSHGGILDALLGLSEKTSDSILSVEEIQNSRNWSVPADGRWGKWGMFYPKGAEDHARWVLYRLFKTAGEVGLAGSWKQVFTVSYDPDELYGIPFRIGDYSDSQRVTGIILIGPHPSSGLGAQEQEFRHITSKILDSMLIRCGWMGHMHIKSPSAYIRLLLDLLG